MIEWMWRGEKGEKIYERIEEGVNEWSERERESGCQRICGSTYNKLYREIMPEKQGARYLEVRRKNREENVIWAKMTCGNIGRGYKKGYKEWGCRMCEGETEILQHLVICGEA